MGDYNWYSDKTLEVAADGIRAEAKKWLELSDRMTGVASATADQGLAHTAFAVTDVTGPVAAVDLKHAYDKMHSLLTGLFNQAVTELDKFGQALNKCADWYETSDANSAETFDQIATS